MSHFLTNIAGEPYNVYTEYVAARTIQSYFRGYTTRKYIKYLHENAIIIQCNWRGVLGRKRFNKIIKEKLDIICQNYYNKAATRIQKVFRGYYVRKHVFSFYELKARMKQICLQNLELLNKTEEFKEDCIHKMEEIETIESQKQIELIIFKLHHLLRTNQIEGIYSKKNTTEYSCIEKMMKKNKFKNYMKKRYLQSQAQHMKPATQHEYIFKGIWRKCEEAWIRRNDPGKYSTFNTGVYGEEENLLAEEEKLINYIKCIQEEPMSFRKVEHKDDIKDTLAFKEYKCPHK